MQVTSTLWPDIKLQKLSEHRFRLNWTKCSLRTTPNPLKTDQDQRGPDKAAQDSPPEEAGATGRPADQPVGPNALIQTRGDVS